MEDEVPPAVSENSGDMEDPVAHGLGFSLGQCAVETRHLAPGQQCAGDQDTATQAWLAQKPSKGRLERPQAFQQRTRSSTRAWPR